jgi:hypothetical protein
MAFEGEYFIVPHIPYGKKQAPAMAGSITRAIPHPDGSGGTSPAGVIASFYAVLPPVGVEPEAVEVADWQIFPNPGSGILNING